ncbi:PPE domain-containing protein [Mycobacterium shinjukuense]|uniref:PPE domain-containing protein n=1 Tax=Mycobacterium shinjukuense TaxID=398694 RepID=UPI003100D905
MTKSHTLVVSTQELVARAAELEAPAPGRPHGGPKATCHVAAAYKANLALTLNIKAVQTYLDAGEGERRRLAQALRNAAKAYGHVDDNAAQAVNGQGPVSAVTTNAADGNAGFVALPYADVTKAEHALANAGASEYLPWEEAVTRVHHDDQGASLGRTADAWRAYRLVLEEISQRLRPFEHWTGDAATAAQAAFDEHRQWLDEMAQLCDQLASQAQALKSAQQTLVDHHPDEKDVKHYRSEKRAIFPPVAGQSDWPHMPKPRAFESRHHYVKRLYRHFQHKSEHALANYAQMTALSTIQPSLPPSAQGSISGSSPSGPLAEPTPAVLPPDVPDGPDLGPPSGLSGADGLPETPTLPAGQPASPSGAGPVRPPTGARSASGATLPTLKPASLGGGGAGGGGGVPRVPLEAAPLLSGGDGEPGARQIAGRDLAGPWPGEPSRERGDGRWWHGRRADRPRRSGSGRSQGQARVGG